MSVVPTDSDDHLLKDRVYKYAEASAKEDASPKVGDKELLAMLRKMHELMQKEVDEKENKAGKKEEGPGSNILIADDFKYWWSPHTWPKRLYYSSFMNLLMGNNVNIDEIVEVINTLALINALILTIPYGLVMDLGYDYWERLRELVDGCKAKHVTIDFNYDEVLQGYRDDFVTIIYGATMSLILILIYYLLRPRGNEELFRRWWITAGNKMFPVLCVLTICSIVALLTLSSHLLKYNFVHPDSFCNTPNRFAYQIGYGILVFMVAVAIWMML